ncbi:50S ribosomal protein L30 [Salinicoccus sp. ID82-1]|uniref:50S ribosomal protein L30 n=1 Tax=Salinicoccus sp. ID82-1 TaxID=2820269 RepID=UPI001F00A07A|nr:50S ribosomal protein L30 [Salinicoccus sp. ID82-1]MCG1010401.1 50S ribosomal protein L30 [Salinicoccus sp. ID82-1]
MAKIKITLVKSLIGKPETQRRTVASLGLRKLHHSVEREDTPQLRGQVAKVSHLVSVEEK